MISYVREGGGEGEGGRVSDREVGGGRDCTFVFSRGSSEVPAAPCDVGCDDRPCQAAHVCVCAHHPL